MTYKIIRHWFEDKPNRTIKKGLTLEQAQKHCNDEKTHCTSKHTTDESKWFFDGYTRE